MCVCVLFVCGYYFYQCFQFCPVQIDSQWLSTMMVSLFPIACLRCLRCRRTTKFGTSAWGPGCRRQSRMWGWASMASILSPWLFDHHEKNHELMIFTSWTHDIPLIFTWYSHEIPMIRILCGYFRGDENLPSRNRRHVWGGRHATWRCQGERCQSGMDATEGGGRLGTGTEARTSGIYWGLLWDIISVKCTTEPQHWSNMQLWDFEGEQYLFVIFYRSHVY